MLSMFWALRCESRENIRFLGSEVTYTSAVSLPCDFIIFVNVARNSKTKVKLNLTHDFFV